MDRRNLNYRSLGKLLDYSDVQIRRIILNTSVPKIDFIQHFCSAFPDIDIDWLILGKEKKVVVFDKEDLENVSKYVFDNWENLIEDRLFKANFESKAASWALDKVKNK